MSVKKQKRLEYDKRAREATQMAGLLRLHEAGKIVPELVGGYGAGRTCFADSFGELPPRPTRAMVAVVELMKLWMGLRLADGTDDPLPLSTTKLEELGIASQAGASKLLRRLEDDGVIWSPGALAPRRGRPDGTKVWLPGKAPNGAARFRPLEEWRVLPAIDAGSDLVPEPGLEPGPVPVEAEVGVLPVTVEPAMEGPDEPGMADAVRTGPADPLDWPGAPVGGAEVVGARVVVHEAEGYEPVPKDHLEIALVRAERLGASRNAEGFVLANRLIDRGVSRLEAEEIMFDYVTQVNGRAPKDHKYEWDEALRSLGSAQRSRSRITTPGVGNASKGVS